MSETRVFQKHYKSGQFGQVKLVGQTAYARTLVYDSDHDVLVAGRWQVLGKKDPTQFNKFLDKLRELGFEERED